MRRKRSRDFGFGFLPTAVLFVVIIAIALAVVGYLRAQNNKDAKFSPDNKSDAQIFENSLKLHFIDVGQADSTLIESKDGKFMLVDAGTYDSGRKICDYLKANGVKELEYVIFTHPHEDHIGAGARVLENFDVKNVIMTQKTSNSSTYEILIDKLLECKNNGTNIIAPKVMDEYEFDGASFEILSADGNNDDTNNSSIVFRLTYGKCSFMFTGDAEKPIEKEILKLDTNLNSVLLKCGHHGSSTSTCEDFLEAVNPKCAIISCGLDNSYGHPHVETISALNDIKATVYRTDEMGDIVMYCDEQKLYFGTSSKAK